MEDIDLKIAEVLGRVFSMPPTAPNKFVGRVCTLRLDKGSSIVSFDTTIRLVYHRTHYHGLNPFVVEIVFIFDTGIIGKIHFSYTNQNDQGVDLSSSTVVEFDKLPIYLHSKGSGNITIHEP